MKVSNGRQFVESIHLSTLLASYNHHSAIYSEARKNVSQLIPGAVWRSIYKEILEVYPNAQFSEETLKKKVADELKSAKTGTSNMGDGRWQGFPADAICFRAAETRARSCEKERLETSCCNHHRQKWECCPKSFRRVVRRLPKDPKDT
jgi:hypothetical protein